MLRKKFKELLKKTEIYCFTPDFLIKDLEEKLSAIESILKKGCGLIQLREKEMNPTELLIFGKEVKKLAEKYSTFFIVNDSIEVAVKLDADGVHLGQSDDPVDWARKVLKGKIIGLSITTYDEFVKSKNLDLDYIGVGPVFPTKTKKVEKYVSLKLLKRITEESPFPVAVIGGITPQNMKQLNDYNIKMYCMISAMY